MAVVFNHDVAGLHRRMNRFIKEVNKASSGNVASVSAPDKTRALAYLSAVRSYITFVDAQPQLDLPETNPREYPLEEDPAIDNVENEDMNDLVRLFTLARDELVSSQSARLAAGVLPFDKQRVLDVVAKMESFINDYIDDTAPMDLPETAPMREITKSGNTGTKAKSSSDA